jgi:hypothetical protein
MTDRPRHDVRPALLPPTPGNVSQVRRANSGRVIPFDYARFAESVVINIGFVPPDLMKDALGVALIALGAASLWLRRHHAENEIAEEIYQYYRRMTWIDVDLYFLVGGVIVILVGAGILFGLCG